MSALIYVRIDNRVAATIEITPPEPFYKGIQLPAGILILELIPETSAH